MKSFLTGLATGLAIGYLTADRSGKETRDRLVQAANRQVDGLKAQWGKTTSLVNQIVDDVKTESAIIKDDLSVFADITTERLDQYKTEFGQVKSDVPTT